MADDSTLRTQRARWRLWIAAGALAIGISACGGSEAPVSTTESAAATSDAAAVEADAAPVESGDNPIAAAEANIGLLQPSSDVVSIEVLDVSDGSISTLQETVDGDRPVLLWFFSPH